jgi:hypothetical protein
MIKNSGMESEVVSLIEETWTNTGTLLDVEDAARQIEEQLVEEAYKLAKLSKIQNKFKAPESAGPVPPQKQEGMRTLTQASSQSPSCSTRTRTTDKERRERALLAFHNKLNQ